MRTKRYNEWLGEAYSDPYDDPTIKAVWFWNMNTKPSGSVRVMWDGLENLINAPSSVLGSFDCTSNHITSLKGGPKEVKGDFLVSDNKLTSLTDSPESLGGSYICSDNLLTSLEGVPEEINVDFIFQRNKLTSLKGAPKSVKGNFACTGNPLTSLEDAPKEIGGEFRFGSIIVNRGEWGPRGWLKAIDNAEEEDKKLAMTLFTEESLDNWFKEIPHEISSLDDWPEIKAGVLNRTGIRDMSKLSRNLKTGLI